MRPPAQIHQLRAPPLPLWKRAFDLWTAAMITAFVVPLIGIFALVMLITEGRPVFYGAERMQTPRHSFTLWKFRSMRPDPDDWGVSGTDKQHRITRFGGWLRRRRLDELPQLWNLWRGDISVVGPRPPDRRYVEKYPEIYAQVLQTRPGLTGLATVAYGRHEEMLLARVSTAEETEALYCRACVPRKARIDLIYQRNRSLWLDLGIVRRTLFPRGRASPQRQLRRGFRRALGIAQRR
ncbi:sugar transferase [Pararhodobacter oceanensis]|uniref:sugar transferase n=1 Tax=Pararhodobacter oceanensis TaxID=2172121 RepID=UPI003A90AA9B